MTGEARRFGPSFARLATFAFPEVHLKAGRRLATQNATCVVAKVRLKRVTFAKSSAQNHF